MIKLSLSTINTFFSLDGELYEYIKVETELYKSEKLKLKGKTLVDNGYGEAKYRYILRLFKLSAFYGTKSGTNRTRSKRNAKIRTTAD